MSFTCLEIILTLACSENRRLQYRRLHHHRLSSSLNSKTHKHCSNNAPFCWLFRGPITFYSKHIRMRVAACQCVVCTNLEYAVWLCSRCVSNKHDQRPIWMRLHKALFIIFCGCSQFRKLWHDAHELSRIYICMFTRSATPLFYLVF